MLAATQLKKFNHDHYSEICEHIACRDAALDLLDIKIPPAELLLKFIREKFYYEAVQLLACGLPRRESIWWGYLCVQHAAAVKPIPAVQRALTIIQQWVKNPNGQIYHEAEALAEQLGYHTPTAWVAIAVFYSGNKLAAAEKYLPATAAANAITQAALNSGTPDTAYLRYIKQGIHIANGGNGTIHGEKS